MAINLTYTTQCLHVKTIAIATICYTFNIYEDKGYIQTLWVAKTDGKLY